MSKANDLKLIAEKYQQVREQVKLKTKQENAEAYEHAPNESEEIETSNVKIEKHGNKFKILNKKTNMYVGGEFNNLENAKKIAQYIENRFDKNDVQFEDEFEDEEGPKMRVTPPELRPGEPDSSDGPKLRITSPELRPGEPDSSDEPDLKAYALRVTPPDLEPDTTDKNLTPLDPGSGSAFSRGGKLGGGLRRG
jgi:hypothetical protein